MQSAATKQETTQLFPSQWIYVYPTYIEEGNPISAGRPAYSNPCP